MSQNNLTISDGNGFEFRTAINNSNKSLASLFAGTSDPASLSPSCAFAGMLWMDTGNSLIKQRDSTNATWVRKGSFDANGTIVWDSIVVANNANFNTITSSGLWSVTSGQTNAPNSTEAFYVYVIATSTTNLNQYAIGQTSGNIYSRNNVSSAWQTWSLIYSSANLPSTLRNKLINGNPLLDYRNGGSSQTFTAGAAIAYCVDRWYASCTGANVTGQRVAGTAPYQYAYKITGLASNTATLFGQRIESFNSYDLVNQTATCQLQVSSTSITSLTWTAYYANSADTFSAKTQIATGTITINSTPTIYSFSFSAGANAGNGIAIEFTTGALLGTQTISYAGLQLEKGSFSTPFEFLPFNIQDFLCRRYYETGSFYFNIYQAATTPFWSWLQFDVPKRVSPTMVASSVNYSNSSTQAFYSTTVNGFAGEATATALGPTAVSFVWTASSEL